jgi:hypothetical protein
LERAGGVMARPSIDRPGHGAFRFTEAC